MHPNRPILTLAYAAAMSAIAISMIPSNLQNKALMLVHSQIVQRLGAPVMTMAPTHEFVVLAEPASQTSYDEAEVASECARAQLAMARAKVQIRVAQLQAAQGIKIAQMHAAQQMWQAAATPRYWQSRSWR